MWSTSPILGKVYESNPEEPLVFKAPLVADSRGTVHESNPEQPLVFKGPRVKVENFVLKTHGRITNRLNLVDKARINSEI